MSNFLNLIILFVLIYLIYLFIISESYSKKIKLRNDMIFDQISRFSIEHKHYGCETLVAVDRELENICLIELNNIPKGLEDNSEKTFKYLEDNSEKTFKYLKADDILQVELFEGGNSVTSSSRSIGGAVVGGALFGGVGAIVGGLGSSTKSSETVNKIQIRLVVNDKTNPIYDIDFLSVEIDKNELLFESISKQARTWYGYFEVMINNAKDNVEEIKEKDIDVITKLERLNLLKASKAISEEEFSILKKDLLGK
ncbi:SHOCT domain-containing protein [Haemophilus influenzae]|uniref:SHOCT domain-containing protein n=1 Tax=Haemophilus influenzae TaxID=727 RepID=UPI000DD38493|nr:SHOCT domain-containing protein [Haemophilus influenzae]